jgi:hypothetical protein
MTATNEDGEHGPDDPGFAPGGPRDWAAGGEPADDGDDEDGFVPPDPGPVLGGDPLLTMAWTAVIAVPVVLVASTVLTYAVPTALFVAICAVFVAGVGVLVWRLPSHHSPEDDGDNGAVV